jgi:hypothetical protein
MMGERDIEITIDIVNLRYVFRGFDAIKDLKTFCDDNASEECGELACELPNSPEVPTVVTDG